MAQAIVRKWYHSMGPLSWYSDQWIRLEVEFRGRAYGLIWQRNAGRFYAFCGCNVVVRSALGKATTFQGGHHLTF